MQKDRGRGKRLHWLPELVGVAGLRCCSESTHGPEEEHRGAVVLGGLELTRRGRGWAFAAAGWLTGATTDASRGGLLSPMHTGASGASGACEVATSETSGPLEGDGKRVEGAQGWRLRDGSPGAAVGSLASARRIIAPSVSQRPAARPSSPPTSAHPRPRVPRGHYHTARCLFWTVLVTALLVYRLPELPLPSTLPELSSPATWRHCRPLTPIPG